MGEAGLGSKAPEQKQVKSRLVEGKLVAKKGNKIKVTTYGSRKVKSQIGEKAQLGEMLPNDAAYAKVEQMQVSQL